MQKFADAAKKAKKEQNYKVWQDGYHAIETWSEEFIYQKLNYIHQNPVEDQTVEKPEDYLYSSARNYADMEGKLEVIVLPHRLKTY